MSDHVNRRQLSRITAGAILLLIFTCMATFAAARYLWFEEGPVPRVARTLLAFRSYNRRSQSANNRVGISLTSSSGSRAVFMLHRRNSP